MDSFIRESGILDRITRNTEQAAALLKALSHPGRLLIACHLLKGDMTVSELEKILGWRQSAVSQQLSRLRDDNIVAPRRSGKSVHYSISDIRTREIIVALNRLY